MKRLLVILLTILALASCAKKKIVIEPEGIRKVEFTTSVDTYSTKATDSALEAGDQVRIVACDPIDATAIGTYGSNGTMTLDNPILWNKDQTESTTFAAIYQKSGVPSTSTSLSYDLLYGGKHDYESHNLFLVAVRTAAPETIVNLNFKHPFSKIVIGITNKLDGDEVSKVEIKDVVMKGSVDVVESALDLTGTKESFEAYKMSAVKYAAIVMPQKATPTIVVTTKSGKTFSFVPDSETTFASGYAYSSNLTLEPETVIEHGEVTFSFSVIDWADGGSLDYDFDKDNSHE